MWGLYLTHHVLGLWGLRARGGQKVPEVFPNRRAWEELLGGVRMFPAGRGGRGRTWALRNSKLKAECSRVGIKRKGEGRGLLKWAGPVQVGGVSSRWAAVCPA